jgi:hypothetical protein
MLEVRHFLYINVDRGKGLGFLYSLMWIGMLNVRLVVYINVDRGLRVRVFYIY